MKKVQNRNKVILKECPIEISIKKYWSLFSNTIKHFLYILASDF